MPNTIIVGWEQWVQLAYSNIVLHSKGPQICDMSFVDDIIVLFLHGY